MSCDSNEECQGDLECHRNVGPDFGGGDNIDVCGDPLTPQLLQMKQMRTMEETKETMTIEYVPLLICSGLGILVGFGMTLLLLYWVKKRNIQNVPLRQFLFEENAI